MSRSPIPEILRGELTSENQIQAFNLVNQKLRLALKGITWNPVDDTIQVDREQFTAEARRRQADALRDLEISLLQDATFLEAVGDAGQVILDQLTPWLIVEVSSGVEQAIRAYEVLISTYALVLANDEITDSDQANVA